MSASASLIIAVYKRPDFLEKIFASLQYQTFTDFEVLVADDGSGADVAETVRQFAEHWPRPVKHVRHENVGFRKTIIVNEAVTSASSDYLIFIDGDCILHHRFMECHLNHKRRGVVLAGRRVMLDESVTSRLTIEDVVTKRLERPGFWWNNCLAGQRKHGFFVPGAFAIENALGKRYWIVGSNFSVHASDFRAINGYDESIVGRGVEDINLTARFRLNGIRICTITREALQYHLFHRSDPVPHDAETYQRLCFPKQSWAESGINRNSAASSPASIAMDAP
jgi:glycosyltransferase involved in cell wall biosynthesis